MKKTQLVKQKIRKTRAMRVRKKLRGNESKPRLSVIKSNQHIHAQLIDDEKGVTIISCATSNKELRGTEFGKRNKTAARKVGEMIGKAAKEKNVQEIIFDRGRFKYHGILAELADAARESGLKF